MIDGLSCDFPHLKKSTKASSPPTPEYNCIAWALNKIDEFWWPHPEAVWPMSSPEEETISAFQMTFSIFGYEPCENGQLESDYEKIALYAKNNRPKHAARQLKNGKWTSKCGSSVDLEHELHELEGERYGQVVMYFRRKRSNQ